MYTLSSVVHCIPHIAVHFYQILHCFWTFFHTIIHLKVEVTMYSGHNKILQCSFVVL